MDNGHPRSRTPRKPSVEIISDDDEDDYIIDDGDDSLRRNQRSLLPEDRPLPPQSTGAVPNTSKYWNPKGSEHSKWDLASSDSEDEDEYYTNSAKRPKHPKRPKLDIFTSSPVQKPPKPPPLIPKIPHRQPPPSGPVTRSKAKQQAAAAAQAQAQQAQDSLLQEAEPPWQPRREYDTSDFGARLRSPYDHMTNQTLDPCVRRLTMLEDFKRYKRDQPTIDFNKHVPLTNEDIEEVDDLDCRDQVDLFDPGNRYYRRKLDLIEAGRRSPTRRGRGRGGCVGRPGGGRFGMGMGMEMGVNLKSEEASSSLKNGGKPKQVPGKVDSTDWFVGGGQLPGTQRLWDGESVEQRQMREDMEKMEEIEVPQFKVLADEPPPALSNGGRVRKRWKGSWRVDEE